MIHLKRKDLEAIKQIAQETYPHECCGILVGSVEDGVKTVTELIPAQNQRTDSLANRYLITADFLHQIEGKLRNTSSSIVGFFHSHPDVPARPSAYDKEHAWPWYSYLIVSVIKGQAEEVLNWQLREDRSAFDPEIMELV
ncbi:M67 family metallopeptidase [Acidobacteria bacterium AH-259-D05]|nr:M67 family metallopeptidase [Acidobacteria bacterium AH-259-D05]